MSHPACEARMRESEPEEEGEIVRMCVSFDKGEVSLRETKMESGRMCLPHTMLSRHLYSTHFQQELDL